jgi:hypothetical protein
MTVGAGNIIVASGVGSTITSARISLVSTLRKAAKPAAGASTPMVAAGD